MMEILPDAPRQKPDVDARLDQLAARYRAAGGVGIEVLNLIGGKAEGLLERLPESVRDGLDSATEAALLRAMKAAHGSRRMVPEAPGWLAQTVTTALGAAGGAGGMPTALAEIPVTTTVLLRSIQDVAAREGFDPGAESVRFDCVRVFASAGPLEKDDGADLAFVSTRLAVTGPTVRALIARVAPRLSVVLGQKLAAQTVPVLGAVAGAATNYAYTSYYREIAHVHFGVRRLAIESGEDSEALIQRLREKVTIPVREARG